jgi:hypothetical protein
MLLGVNAASPAPTARLSRVRTDRAKLHVPVEGGGAASPRRASTPTAAMAGSAATPSAVHAFQKKMGMTPADGYAGLPQRLVVNHIFRAESGQIESAAGSALSSPSAGRVDPHRKKCLQKSKQFDWRLKTDYDIF